MASPIDQYALPAVMTVAGMHQLVHFTKAVGAARKQYGVKVPETTGPPEFIRTFRAHQNSLEFYPISLASLWVGSVFFHPVPASVAYLGYLYGRQKYFSGYVEDTEKRIPGFKLSIRCLMLLGFMCLFGAGHKLVRFYGDIDLWQLVRDHIPILKDEL